MSSSNNPRWRDYNTISDEWNENRKKLKCCRDMIKAVNTGLIDWFNEFYGERYCSLTLPHRGYYIFSTDDNNQSKAVMQIYFCPFCGYSCYSPKEDDKERRRIEK